MTVLGDDLDLLLGRESGASSEEVEAELRTADNGSTVYERHPREEREDDKPEPEEHIDLLVDDVQRENAQTIELLH